MIHKIMFKSFFALLISDSSDDDIVSVMLYSLSDKQPRLDTFFTEKGIEFSARNSNDNCPSYLLEIV